MEHPFGIFAVPDEYNQEGMTRFSVEINGTTINNVIQDIVFGVSQDGVVRVKSLEINPEVGMVNPEIAELVMEKLGFENFLHYNDLLEDVEQPK